MVGRFTARTAGFSIAECETRRYSVAARPTADRLFAAAQSQSAVLDPQSLHGVGRGHTREVAVWRSLNPGVADVYQTQASPSALEQGQVRRSEGTAQAKADMGNPSPTSAWWKHTRPRPIQSGHRFKAPRLRFVGTPRRRHRIGRSRQLSCGSDAAEKQGGRCSLRPKMKRDAL